MASQASVLMQPSAMVETGGTWKLLGEAMKFVEHLASSYADLPGVSARPLENMNENDTFLGLVCQDFGNRDPNHSHTFLCPIGYP